MVIRYLTAYMTALSLLLISVTAYSQSDSVKISLADKLIKEYKFKEALEIYKEVLQVDSLSVNKILLQNKIFSAENGINLLNYANKPELISTIIVPIYDFYLRYPEIYGRKWIRVPKEFSPEGDPIDSVTNAISYRASDKTIIYSAKNSSGNWDLFCSSRIDSTGWSYPLSIGEAVNTSGDEVFPFLSDDGKSLYFSSNGHPGLGGFDLFVSHWEGRENRWGAPRNLGFPYSTPYNDLLFALTNDEYAVFASDRESSSSDTVSLYLIRREQSPLTFKLEKLSEIQSVANLRYHTTASGNDSKRIDQVPTAPELAEYIRRHKIARAKADEIDSLTKKLAPKRALYIREQDQSKKIILSESIIDVEKELSNLQLSLDTLVNDLLAREKSLYRSGIIIPDSVYNIKPIVADRVDKEQDLSETWSEGVFGESPEIKIIQTTKLLDQKFKIGSKTEILKEYKFPEEIVYSIRLFAVKKKLAAGAFKNISPIIEIKANKTDYLYYAGIFYTKADMEKALDLVKSLGFKKATASVFNKGKNISLKQAAALSHKEQSGKPYQLRLGSYPLGIPNNILAVIRKSTDKDIAKKFENGEAIYFVGPFGSKAEAEELQKILLEFGEQNVKLEFIE